ncbi:MAG: hypothetical protein ABEJ66_03755, partial [Candidatus Nanohaloarchaea archaeon]
TGDTPLIYRQNGEVRYGEIGEMIDRQMERNGEFEKLGRELLKQNPEDIEVLSMDEDGKFSWSKVNFFMR